MHNIKTNYNRERRRPVYDVYDEKGLIFSLCRLSNERNESLGLGSVSFPAIPVQAYNDPHHCWDSCAEPGEACLGCTNPDYFTCSKSGVCIHPDLRCDGHPHCEFFEDEDLDMCRDIYLERGIIKPHASYICQSLMYPNMTTIATACDDVAECVGRADEASCSTIGSSTAIIAVSLTGVTCLYLGLKISRIIYYKVRGNREQELQDISLPLLDTDLETIRRKYLNNHDEPEKIELMNAYLLHVINSKERAGLKFLIYSIYIQL